MAKRSNTFNVPQKSRNKRRLLSGILIAISVLVLLSDRQQKSMLSNGRFTTDDLSVRVLQAISLPMRGIENFAENSRNLLGAHSENEKLREEVEQLRDVENTVLDLTLRLRRFEEILDIDVSSDVPDRKIAARAVSESGGPFVHSALLNIGANKGVSPGHAVMSADGLYGHIVRVGKTSSRVLLLNDLNSHISVMSQRSLSRAIMVGHNDRQPQLEFISAQADWQIGDRVVSSGDGGVLPRGLVIGQVVDGADKALEVQLFTDSHPIDWVWVLPFVGVVAPEDNPVDELGASQSETTPAASSVGGQE